MIVTHFITIYDFRSFERRLYVCKIPYFVHSTQSVTRLDFLVHRRQLMANLHFGAQARILRRQGNTRSHRNSYVLHKIMRMRQFSQCRKLAQTPRFFNFEPFHAIAGFLMDGRIGVLATVSQCCTIAPAT